MGDPASTVGGRFACRIRLLGRIDATHAGFLGGLSIVVHEGGAAGVTTELTGTLEDQSALMGVLEFLHGLCVPLLSVERLSRSDEPQAMIPARTADRRQATGDRRQASGPDTETLTPDA